MIDTATITRKQFVDAVEAGILMCTASNYALPVARLRTIAATATQSLTRGYIPRYEEKFTCGCPATEVAGGPNAWYGTPIKPWEGRFAEGFDTALGFNARTILFITDAEEFA